MPTKIGDPGSRAASDPSNMRSVIEIEKTKVLSTFDISDTEEVVKEYEAMGVYKMVKVDDDGDIILYKG